MSLLDLFPTAAGLSLEQVDLSGETITLHLKVVAKFASCPVCGRASARVHSRYQRTLTDLPCHGRVVQIRLTARRFFCSSADCARAVFAERLPALAKPRARSTDGLDQAHAAIGFALGGEAGARLTTHLALPTSPDTLLRRVKQAQAEPAPTPRVLGVDDWALRKGQRYATILVDLERGQVVDILPGRDRQTLKSWLQDHPGVEVISRDRWGPYAVAAAQAASGAKQVADRWHLLKNLREAIQHLFERQSAQLQEALASSPGTSTEEPAKPQPALPKEVGRGECSLAKPSPPLPSPQEQARLAKRQRRLERYQRVAELHRQGWSIRHIAKGLAMSRNAVRRYLRWGRCPDWLPGQPRPTRLDGLRADVDRRIREGCRNAAELYRELAAKGCGASYDAVRRFFTRRLAAVGQTRKRANAATPPPRSVPSARQLSFEVVRRPEKRSKEVRARLERLRGNNAELREGIQLAEEFAAMVRKQSKVALAVWLTKASKSCCPEVRRFAEGLRQDEAAVAAALTEKWSNGPVEGQINRLKVIKRQMYGRAGFQLLRVRVLHTE